MAVTEITGSETFVHLAYGDRRWVGLIHGLRHMPPGAEVTVYLDPAHIYLFAEDGGLAAVAPYAQAA